MDDRSRCWRGLPRRVWGSLLLVVLVVTVVGCSPPAADTAPTFAPPSTDVSTPLGVDVYTPTRGTIVQTIESRGRLEAAREAKLMFPLQGLLEAVHVSAGDEVDAGELLAELYAPEAKREAQDAQFALARARTALAMEGLKMDQLRAASSYVLVREAEINLQKAALRLEQATSEPGAAQGSASQEDAASYSYTIRLLELDYGLAECALLQAQRSAERADISQSMQELRLEEAQRALELAQVREAAATERLSSTSLRAPFAGVIVFLDKGVGDEVAAYDPICGLADATELRMVATVLADDLVGIAVGDAAEVELDPYPDRAYTGTVVEISSDSTLWQGREAHHVTIGFDQEQELPTAVDLGGWVVIGGRSRQGVLLVPDRAVITIGDRHYVEVMEDGGDIERVEIETGLSDGNETEVTAGLEEGQRIRLP